MYRLVPNDLPCAPSPIVRDSRAVAHAHALRYHTNDIELCRPELTFGGLASYLVSAIESGAPDCVQRVVDCPPSGRDG